MTQSASKRLVTEARLKTTANVDPTALANGAVPAVLDSGQAGRTFGIAPFTIATGQFAHVPYAGANSAAYYQTDAGARVTRIGADVTFPTGATLNEAIALVLPAAEWRTGGTGPLGPAGVHFVCNAAGTWHLSYWDGAAETLYQPAATLLAGSLADGITRRVEVAIDVATSTAYILLPDGTSAKITDSRIAATSSTWAVWELFEVTGVGATPGLIGAVWADAPGSRASARAATPADIAKAVASINSYAAVDPGLRYAAFTASGTFVVPAFVNKVRARAVGGGGSGGGGGSALTTGGVTNQTGGGGGGAGNVHDMQLIVVPGESLTVTIAAAATGGAGGAVNSNPGITGATGGAASLLRSATVLLTANGGYGGGLGAANSGAGTVGGNPFMFPRQSSPTAPGAGGGTTYNGVAMVGFPSCGGGAGGSATATNGGSAGTSGALNATNAGVGSTGGSGTSTGADGTAFSTAIGCGGGGGGGGAPGGAGGTGAPGKAGQIEIWW